MSAALSTIPASVAVAHAEGEGDKKVAFSPKEFRAFPVRKIQSISPNTKVIELALPTPEHEMVSLFVTSNGCCGDDDNLWIGHGGGFFHLDQGPQ